MDDFDPLDLRTSQLAALVGHAGRMEPDRLAAFVGVSPEELAEAARFYRIDIRHYEAEAVWCATCGEQRIPNKAKSGHWCPVCRARERLAEARDYRARAYAAMDPRDQERTEHNAATNGIRRKARADAPRPRETDYEPADPRSEYERRAARERYLADLQAWEVERCDRETRTARRAGERYLEKASDALRWTDPEHTPGVITPERAAKLHEAAKAGAQRYRERYSDSIA